MTLRRVYGFIIIFFFSSLAYCHSDSLAKNQNGYYSLSYVLKNFRAEIPFEKYQALWLFNSRDDFAYKSSDINESKWIPVKCYLNGKDIQKLGFNGLAWFRLHLYIDTVSGSGYSFIINHRGASMIYFNGTYYGGYGIVSSNSENEVQIEPQNESIELPELKKGTWLTIAVRYSNMNYKKTSNAFGSIEGGFRAEIKETSSFIFEMKSHLLSSSVIGVSLFVFFFTLACLHFLLYVFYRARRSNLYYSILCAILAIIFLQIILLEVIQYPNLLGIFKLCTALISPFFFYMLIVILNSLFEFRVNLLVKILFVLTCICSASIFIHGIVYFALLVLCVLGTLIYSLYLLYLALVQKKKGAKLISSGFGFFATFMIVFFVFSTLTGGLDLSHLSVSVIILVILLCLCIVSIPISMSVFLAWDFARTNNSLSEKLVEVEELSIRSIEQEKEKQKILSDQNEKLELQVTERTKEIQEQKKLIEEKNKDITDSINYAQRIQRSILPTPNEIKAIFESAFVLFKPRDIVSGDFYQFKKVGDLKFCILADCTGHGVPGALMSMIGSNLLQQIIVERKISEPNKILSELHKEVKSTLRQTSGVQSHDGMDASVVLLKGNKLYISSANRPVYVIQNKIPMEIKADKRSIGGSQSSDEIAFTVTELDIEQGMMIYLYSDGYADQFGGESGKKFKVKKLNELLLAINEEPLDVQHQILDTTFDNWKNQLEQVDDVCIIGIRL